MPKSANDLLVEIADNARIGAALLKYVTDPAYVTNIAKQEITKAIITAALSIILDDRVDEDSILNFSASLGIDLHSGKGEANG